MAYSIICVNPIPVMCIVHAFERCCLFIDSFIHYGVRKYGEKHWRFSLSLVDVLSLISLYLYGVHWSNICIPTYPYIFLLLTELQYTFQIPHSIPFHSRFRFHLPDIHHHLPSMAIVSFRYIISFSAHSSNTSLEISPTLLISVYFCQFSPYTSPNSPLNSIQFQIPIPPSPWPFPPPPPPAAPSSPPQRAPRSSPPCIIDVALCVAGFSLQNTTPRPRDLATLPNDASKCRDFARCSPDLWSIIDDCLGQDGGCSDSRMLMSR